MSIVEQDAPEQTFDGASVLDAVRQKHTEIKGRKIREKVVEIPSWNGALAVRYRYPEGGSKPIVKAVERAERAPSAGDDAFAANCDVLIACCHEVVGRRPDGDWEVLDESDPRPVKFTQRLADLLRVDVPDGVKSPGRFIVRALYSPQADSLGVWDGDMALMRHAADVLSWLTQADLEATGHLAGE